LTLAEATRALTYYFDHREEIEEELVAEYHSVEDWKKSAPDAALARPTETRSQALMSVGLLR